MSEPKVELSPYQKELVELMAAQLANVMVIEATMLAKQAIENARGLSSQIVIDVAQKASEAVAKIEPETLMPVAVTEEVTL